MRTKAKIYISIDTKTLDHIKVLAKMDNRNVSNYIDTILRDHVEKNRDKVEE